MVISSKRRRFFIKRAFQLRYAVIILLLMFLTAAISCLVTYFAIFPYLSGQLANVYPQGRLIAMLKNAHARAALSTLWLLPIAAWFSIILSHRIAGPWYRLELILKDVAEGKITSEIKLRKGDELQSLADAINETIKNLRSMNQENLSYLQSLNEAVVFLEQEMNREPLDPMKTKLLLSKIQDLSTDLKTSLKAGRSK